MTAQKLSDAEKQEILQLYRTTGETSSSLGERYGVSTSTVSRLLKSTLPADEYEALIQQKRSLRSVEPSREASAHSFVNVPANGVTAVDESPTVKVDVLELDDTEIPDVLEEPALAVEADGSEPDDESDGASFATAVESALSEDTDAGFDVPPTVEPTRSKTIKPTLRRSRRRSSSQLEFEDLEAEQLEVPLEIDSTSEETLASEPDTRFAEAEVLKEILSQNVIEPEEDLADELDDDLDDEDEDEPEDGEFDGDLNQSFFVNRSLKDGFSVQILPFEEASLPRTCYLVVDRSAELIAPPLKDFGDLGQIPAEEVQAKTLPVFDNHRIAKRYSNPRTQRVIKLPDARVLSKTSSHLRAKGITRLLIDGRVYSLT